MGMSNICEQLGLGVDDKKMLKLAIYQCNSIGALTMADFRRQICERLPAIFITLNEILGTDSNTTNKMIRNGYISSRIIPDLLKKYEESLNGSKLKSKRPIDIAIIDSVYDSMIKYKQCKSENQYIQLSLACDMIVEILKNAVHPKHKKNEQNG